jgi:hypothetical protein
MRGIACVEPRRRHSGALARPRRAAARLLVIGVLALVPLGAAACGAAGHYVGGVIAHHIANRVLGHRRASQAYCIYSVYRSVHDFRHHHLLFGALNLHQAYVNCRAGFSRNAR